MKGEASQPGNTQWNDLPQLPPADTHNPIEDEVHLWLIHLEVAREALTACATCLSPDETARAERFRFQHLRDRYTVTRGVVRQILASYLDTPAAELRFTYGPQGKPSLGDQTNLTFNISHSQNLAILAIAGNHRIGIDIELREVRRDLDQIAERNFTPTEAAAIASLPIEQRTNAFYACWTLKEAYLKALGDGLSTPLDSFEVQFPPIAPTSLASIASSPEEHLRWQAYSVTLEHHSIALIVEGKQHSIHRALWNPRSQSG